MRFVNGYPMVVVFLGLALWEVVARSGHFPAALFPSFGFILNQIWAICSHWDGGWTHIVATIYRMMLGFVFALGNAVILGLLIGNSSSLYKSLQGVINFFRSLPGTAMFPVFLLFFGIGDVAKVVIVAFIAFWIILHTTIDGALYASRTRKQVAKLFGAQRLSLFVISWYDSLPYIVLGSKSAISVAFRVSIVSEMFIGSTDGIGQQIFDSYNLYDSATMFARIIVAGAIGSGIARFSLLLERQLLFWKPNKHG